ncbi:MAG: nitrogen fixation protein NifQ [SAR324 cluster bacterium]|nr:nitrogen fixation protein NifQ [SAR324 cluster bacterium]
MNQKLYNLKPELMAKREKFKSYLTPLALESVGVNSAVQILANWMAGLGALPDGLGLDEEGFFELLSYYFPTLIVDFFAPSKMTFDESRLPEREELERLLGNHQDKTQKVGNLWLKVLVAGLNGSDHLWEDMGFDHRGELSLFIATFFPELSVKNTQNMKWKKFIYKQMCIAEEIGYTCRAPSCEVCADYENCFETI